MTKRLLIADDEEEIRDLLEFDLSQCGYEIVTASDGAEALKLALNKHFDLVMLDVMMPKMNGFDVCKSIKAQKPEIPVFLLTAKGTINDKTSGFNAGSDDYIVKPFDIREVILRVRALLNRNTPRSASKKKQDILKAGAVEMFPDSLEVSLKEAPRMKLTPIEFDILFSLLQNFGTPVSLAKLLNEVWGYKSDEDVRMLRVHVGGLRQKIEPDPKHPTYIHTITNVGYKLTVFPDAPEISDVADAPEKNTDDINHKNFKAE